MQPIAEPVYWVERAIAALRPGQRVACASLGPQAWADKLRLAHIELNRALSAANFWGDRRARASVMRMTNWVRAEKRRVAKGAL